MTLRFGTAGLRGPVGDGPDCMNVGVIERTTAGLAAWLRDKCLGGGVVVVGRDARHGSEEFALAAAEVLAADGFDVVLLPRPLPTPLVAFAVRRLGAVAGVQITASHNPPADNGYKAYVHGGAPLAAPADREIEDAIARVGQIRRSPVAPADDALVTAYLDRVATLPYGSRRDVRIALTPLHGVGGDVATAALRAAGFTDIHTVATQFDPDPNFPTVTFPNPEEPGATDQVLALAESVGADVAIALDPDADRCAVGIPGPDGWRMLTGDETGALLGDRILAHAPEGALVATTIVSSTLLGRIADARGQRSARTLTGFKWLVRAGAGLVYAYEEAVGHCVDPDVVRDKDGISAAVLVADLVADLAGAERTLQDALDDLAVEFGVHVTGQVSRRFDDLDEIARTMDRLRAHPPAEIAGITVEATDLAAVRGPLRTDAVTVTGRGLQVTVRPSGTEPKLKAYFEVVEPVPDRGALASARAAARGRADLVRRYLQRM
ncbi:phospho-sugar mutase [Prescottella agglutinans]|uniref:Phosphomannomutase n=1 Tax=Prescottella agglutinans TaxID=1644129 RepID=A0ABT6M4Z4_9NOCA|nr:phospho-sugar mutase [Prescottella agglutinans]MDH6279375.1 phosphomannomutase [Prescottella agglutinans]